MHAHASVGMAPSIDDRTNIACFAVLASRTTAAALIHQQIERFKKTTRSRADDGILRHTPSARTKHTCLTTPQSSVD